MAVSAYVIAVAASGTSTGVLSAYPSDQPVPAAGTGSTVNFTATGSTVNFTAGLNSIGNTSNITLCDPASCPPEGELEILSRNSSQHVLIDIQGYYYSAATSCPDDMVSSGSVCIDKYEASLWNAATGGNQIPPSSCAADGSDCSKDSTTGPRGALVQIILGLSLQILGHYTLAHHPHDVIDALAVSPAYSEDRMVFIASSQHLFKSANGGHSWKELTNGLDHSHPISSIAIDPSKNDSSTLFISTLGDLRSTTLGVIRIGMLRSMDVFDKHESLASSPHRT